MKKPLSEKRAAHDHAAGGERAPRPAPATAGRRAAARSSARCRNARTVSSKTAPEARANWAWRRSSWANALTTWTPTIDSSVTVATSRASAARRAGRVRRRGCSYSHISHPVLRDVQQKLADVATVAEEIDRRCARRQGIRAGRTRRRPHFELASGKVFDAERARQRPARALRAAPRLSPGGRPGGGADRGGANGRPRRSLARRLLRIQPAAQHARGAAADARHVDRPGAARHRVGRAVLRSGGRARGGRRPPALPSSPPGAGRVRFEGVDFGYDRPAGPARGSSSRSSRNDGRADRPLGLRQDDARRRSCRASTTRPRAGAVDGVDVRDVTRRSLRREIGVISQDPFLFSATVRENIAFGVPGATEEQVEAAARAAQAHEFIEELPHGYDTVIGERGITLSGGQRQRLAIARALVIDPRILILDDATASVDATTEAQIRAGLARGDARPDDDRDRPPSLHDRARATRSSCSTMGGSSRAAHRRSCSRRARLPRDPRPRAASGDRESPHEGLAGG